MNRLDRSPTATEMRTREAAQWFMRLKHREPSPADLQAWQEWSSQEANQQAYDAVAKVWRYTDGHPDIRRPTAEELQADDYDGLAPVVVHQANVASVTMLRDRRARWLKPLGLAAAVAVAAFLLQFFGAVFDARFPVTERVVQHETGTAQHRKVSLPDGSTVMLGAKTAVSFSFGAQRRSVVLEQGEALFQVARDAKRPFVVLAGGGAITAVGTVFSVRRVDDRVVVSVAEGQVAVAEQERERPRPAASAKAKATLLGEGEQIAYDRSGHVGPKLPTDPQVIALRTEGRLNYRSEPLRYVVRDVNRYSAKEIVFTDPLLDGLLYTGSVQSGQIEDWLEGLKEIYPQLDVVATSDEYILIRSSALPAAEGRSP